MALATWSKHFRHKQILGKKEMYFVVVLDLVETDHKLHVFIRSLNFKLFKICFYSVCVAICCKYYSLKDIQKEFRLCALSDA